MNNIFVMMDIFVLNDNKYINNISDYSYAFFQFIGIFEDKVALLVFTKDKKEFWYCDIINFINNFTSIGNWICQAEIIGDVIIANESHTLVRLYASKEKVFCFDSNDKCFYLIDNNLDYELANDYNFRLGENILRELTKDLKLRRKY